MADNEIPQWAKERAIQLFNEHLEDSGYQKWRATAHDGHPSVTAFARYITEHEEPPADPLLIEAREMAAEHCPALAYAYRSGFYDEDGYVLGVLAGLKRGIEIAKEQGQ